MQEKARQEINEKITDFENLTVEELNHLTYTDAFIKEVMRLFSPASQTFRVTAKQCTLGNYTLPKGTGIMMPAYYIHECTDFERGKEFIPERWLNGKEFLKINLFPANVSIYSNVGFLAGIQNMLGFGRGELEWIHVERMGFFRKGDNILLLLVP